MKQLQYDEQAWSVYTSKVSDYKGAVDTQKRSWRQKVRENSRLAAQSFMKTHCHIVVYDRPEMLFKEYIDWITNLEGSLQLAKNQVVTSIK